MVYRRTARRIARRAARRAFRRGVRRGRRGRRIYRRRRRFFRATQQVVRSYNAHPDKKKITFEWQEHRTLPSIGVRLKQGTYNAAELARAGYNNGTIPVTGIWIHNISRDIMEHLNLKVNEPQYVDTFTQWLSFGFNPEALWVTDVGLDDTGEPPAADDDGTKLQTTFTYTRWKRDMYVAYYHSWVPDLSPEDIWDGWYEEYLLRMSSQGVLGDDLEHPLDPSYSTLWPRKTRERTPMRCLYRRKFRFVSGGSNRFQAIAKVPLPSRWEIKKRTQLESNAADPVTGVQLVSGYVYRIIILTSSRQDTSLIEIPKTSDGIPDVIEWFPRYEPSGYNFRQFIDFNCNTKMVQKPRLLSTADVLPNDLEARVKNIEDTLSGHKKDTLFWRLGKFALGLVLGNVASSLFQGLGILKDLAFTKDTFDSDSNIIMDSFVKGALTFKDVVQTTTGDVTSYNEGDFGPQPDGSYVVPTTGSALEFIDTSLTALDLDIDTLNLEIREMVREVTALDARVKKLEAGIAPSEAVEELVREYQALVQRANVIEGNVTNLTTTVEQQTAELDTVNGQIGAWPNPSQEGFKSIFTEVHDVTEQSKKLKTEIDSAFATAGVSTAAALAAIAGMAAYYAVNKSKLSDAAKIAEQLKPLLDHGDFNLSDYLTGMNDNISQNATELTNLRDASESTFNRAFQNIDRVDQRVDQANTNMLDRWHSVVEDIDDIAVQTQGQQAFINKLADWFTRTITPQVNEAGETVQVVSFEVKPDGFLGRLEADILQNSQHWSETYSALDQVNQVIAQFNNDFQNINNNFLNFQNGVSTGTNGEYQGTEALTAERNGIFTQLGQIITEYPKSVGMTDDEFKTYLDAVLDQPSTVLLDAASMCPIKTGGDGSKIGTLFTAYANGTSAITTVPSTSISSAQSNLSVRDCLKYIVYIAAVAAGYYANGNSIGADMSRMGIPSDKLLQSIV